MSVLLSWFIQYSAKVLGARPFSLALEPAAAVTTLTFSAIVSAEITQGPAPDPARAGYFVESPYLPLV